jgi:hypothetical protein
VINQLQDLCSSGEYERLNKQFSELKVPFKCVCETDKAYTPIVGRSYFVVEPEHAGICCDVVN